MLKNTDFPIDERGRVRVSADLRVTGDDGVLGGAGCRRQRSCSGSFRWRRGRLLRSQRSARSRQAVVLAKNLLAARRGEP